MRNFQDTSETRKRSFIIAFSICMTVHLMMADSSEQSEQIQLFIKVVDATNYVTFVSKKKPTSSCIQKYLSKNAIDIQDGLLEILLEELEEEGALINYGDANESAYKVVKDLNSLRNPIVSDNKGNGTVNDTLDGSFSLSNSQGDTVTELKGFIEKNANKIVTHKEGRNDNPYNFNGLFTAGITDK